MMMDTTLNIKGVAVGHSTDREHNTGCTVILCPKGAVAGVDIRGTTLGTLEIDLVQMGHLVHRINAVLLTGGSAFGLQAVQGVMRYLEERKQGFMVGPFIVPIVVASSIFDLDIATASPRGEHGYQACVASTRPQVLEGRVGVGTGALIGKAFGPEYASPGGVGAASDILGSHTVGAIVVANCFGCVVDPQTHRVLAGPHHPRTSQLVANLDELFHDSLPPQTGANSLLAVVVTDIVLTRLQAKTIAQVSQNGFVQAVFPADIAFDSSVVFVLSTAPESAPKPSQAQLNRLGSTASGLITKALFRAVMKSRE